MERVTITIDVTGDAFGYSDDAKAIEVASMLRQLAAHLDDYGARWMALKLRDANGNTCGNVVVG
jgi:hypothetical protein